MAAFSLLLHALLWLLHCNAIGVEALQIKTSSAHVSLGSESLLFKRQFENDIILALYFRAIYMDTQVRRAQGRNAFHWAIHVTPNGASGKTTRIFHAVNGEEGHSPDPNKFKYESELVDPLKQRSLLARIKIGTQPSHIRMDDMKQFLSQVPVPNKLVDSSENCVSWAVNGIRKLQEKHILESFNIGSKFQDKVTQYAEGRFMAIFQPGTQDVNLGIGRLDIHSGNIIAPEFIESPEKSVDLSSGGKGSTSKGDSSVPKEDAYRVRGQEKGAKSGYLCRRQEGNCIPQREAFGEASERRIPQSLTEEELLRDYERFTEQEFNRMVRQAGHGPLLWRSRNPLSYQRLHDSVQSQKPQIAEEVKGKITEIGGGALAVAGAFLWIRNMIDVFSKNATKWEHAEVVTSILPLVGCAVQAEGNHEEGKDDIVSSGLCFASDLLLFTPAWPVGLAYQVVHLAMGWVSQEERKYDELRKPQVVKQLCHKGWEDHRENILQQFSSSDEFKMNLESQFVSEQLAILYSASHAAGGLHAASLQAAPTTQKRLMREKSARFHGRDELRLSICDELLKRKSRLADDVEKEMMAMMVKEQAEFEDNFFRQVEKFLKENIPHSFGMVLMHYETTEAEISDYVAGVRRSYRRGAALSDKDIRDIRQHIKDLGSPTFCT
ncbi:hypothetical protein CP533_1070 [Ophiocordyceps camponoti-saundersi (nom. inval.)]|nr:hypothetical protein CP533_1070 [Ophiocordyceps camponoti-saundersi (nom. inval.)]